MRQRGSRCQPYSRVSTVVAEHIDTLAKQALSGDEDAWTKLHGLITPRLWGFFRSKSQTESQVEDSVQETWARFLKGRKHYDCDREFEPYIFTIAFRVWIDSGKGAPPTYQLPEDKPDDAPLPADVVFAAERAEQLHRCLELLKPDERTILRQRFWQQMTNSSIAGTMGLEESQVKNKGYKAIKKLATCMQLLDDALANSSWNRQY